MIVNGCLSLCVCRMTDLSTMYPASSLIAAGIGPHMTLNWIKKDGWKLLSTKHFSSFHKFSLQPVVFIVKVCKTLFRNHAKFL